MPLYNGIDTVAVVSFGVFSKTYGSGDGANIASLFVSRGLLEESPESLEGVSFVLTKSVDITRIVKLKTTLDNMPANISIDVDITRIVQLIARLN